MYDLIIIGGGPAGITAGIYAARQKLKTLIFSKETGGQMAKKAVDIENYPGFIKISGLDLVKKFEAHLKEQDVEIKREEVIIVEKPNDFLVKTKDAVYEAKAVIVASGANHKTLDVLGEKEFIGKGVSYCAICDGPLFRGKNVAVIGGGNAGFETAVFLKDYVNKIYILEFFKELKADKQNQDLVADKAEIITGVAVKEIKGNTMVNKLVYQDVDSKDIKELEVEGVFVEVGYNPAVSFIKDLVDLDDSGAVKTETETYQTKTPGLYGAGDVNTGKYKQIITACGEGAKAALAAFEYIKKQ